MHPKKMPKWRSRMSSLLDDMLSPRNNSSCFFSVWLIAISSGYVKIAMERSTMFNETFHYFYGHFQKLFVCLPEGNRFNQDSYGLIIRD